MAAHAGHKVGHGIACHCACISLVVMRVSRKDSVGPETGLGCRSVEVLHHPRTATVIHPSRVGRVMHGDDYGTGIVLSLTTCKCCSEEGKLPVVNRRACAALAGDDTGIFEHVAVDAKDANDGASNVK